MMGGVRRKMEEVVVFLGEREEGEWRGQVDGEIEARCLGEMAGVRRRVEEVVVF